MNPLQQATKTWIESVQKYYEYTPTNELTKIYMRGYFSGWSGREILELAEKLLKNETDYPLHVAKCSCLSCLDKIEKMNNER